MKSRICSVLATLLMLALLACALLYTVPKIIRISNLQRTYPQHDPRPCLWAVRSM